MISVALEPVAVQTDKNNPHFFVMILGVPGSNGLVVMRALPLRRAERLKTRIEQELHAYTLYPEPAGPRASTFWDRLLIETDVE